MNKPWPDTLIFQQFHPVTDYRKLLCGNPYFPLIVRKWLKDFTKNRQGAF